MNFLGIGLGEIILIVIVLLVAVGPERLPAVSRQAGRMLVQIRNWLQSSPDAALIMRARQELEQELAVIKSSLAEVQTVRDEVLDAAKQLNDSVSPLASARINLEELVDAPDTPRPQSADSGQFIIGEPREQPAPSIAGPASDGVSAADSAIVPATPSALLPQELDQIQFKLQAIMTDLWALQEQLKQRGALNHDWKPPSFTMGLPDQQAASPAAQTEEVS